MSTSMIGESLRVVQIGKQTDFDTDVTPTAILMGVEDVSIKPENKTTVLKQLRGSLQPGRNAVMTEKGGSGKVDIQATYEDSLYLVESLLGVATPSGGGPYTRDYAAPSAAAVATPRINTFMVGYAGASTPYQLVGAHTSKLSIKAATGEPVMMSAELVGYEVKSGTLASLSERAVNQIMGHECAIYVDAWGGTIGSTQIENLAYSFELEIDPARALGRRLSLLPSTVDENMWGGTLKMSMMVAATTETLLTAIAEAVAAERRQIRILFTSGTNIFRVDFGGAFVEAPEIYTVSEDMLALEFSLEASENTSLGNFLKIHSVNSVSAIP